MIYIIVIKSMDNTDYFMLEDWRFELKFMVDKWTKCFVSVFLKNFFISLFGILHHLVPKQKRERKKRRKLYKLDEIFK